MSIDVHEAVKAIRDMAPIIDPEEDYLSIVGAEEKIATTQIRRKKELEESQAHLKALSKILEAARISSMRPSSVPSAEIHASILNELDTTRLSLGKSISDAEGLVASKEAQLAALKEETRRLEDCDTAVEHEKELDGTALRLQMYKRMGFEPVSEKNGKITKMLVRAQSGDIHSVEFNDDKADFEYAQLLWKLASS